LSAVRLTRLVALLSLAAISEACLVVSLQPAYDPETIAFEPALVGTWTSDEDEVIVTIERGEWHSYHIDLEDNGNVTRLSGRLTRIGALPLLDLTPLDGTDIPPLQIPVHGLFRVEAADGTMTFAALDYDHFYAMARAGDKEAGLVLDARKNAVLTASTADLRRWLQAHAEDAGLFSEPVVLKRKPSAAPTAP
jgi:hypothetical protein